MANVSKKLNFYVEYSLYNRPKLSNVTLKLAPYP